MKTLVYPGPDNEPAQIDYGFSFIHKAGDPHVDIVAVHTRQQGLPDASLIIHNESRDQVLNIIFAKELSGVRVDRIRFFVLLDAPGLGKTLGFEFPFELDFEDYKRKGHPYQIDQPAPANWMGRLFLAFRYRPVRYWTKGRDVISGCARFRTPFEQRRGLETAEITKLCEAVGHSALGRSLPPWLQAIVATDAKN